MNIGIPVERSAGEYRVGLTPQGVQLLSRAGHTCYIERGAGEGSGYDDPSYEKAGGRIVYSPDEAYQRADLVLKVSAPTDEELGLVREGQAICAFWHLSARTRGYVTRVLDLNLSAIAYEAIQGEDPWTLPVLHPLSEIAGRMLPQIAARWLQNDGGGNGFLIGGVAGVPPIEVAIIGGGTVGVNAARTFHSLGARVLVLDTNLRRLQYLDRLFEGQVATMVAHDFNIEKVCTFANVLVGSVLQPGDRAPVLVTREMVRSMRPRSVIIDVSIDQGGCVETSRLTNHFDPVFIEHEVIHYCVPNISGVVARTATNAYLNAAWPYIQLVANEGVEKAIELSPDLSFGTLVHAGKVRTERLAAMMEVA
jgi:alanine dehydrogenase